MTNYKWIDGQLNDLFFEGLFWGGGLLILGSAGLVWSIMNGQYDETVGLLFVLSIAAIGAGIVKLNDAMEIKRIINAMKE